jgi:hypothetical protein
MLGVCGGRSTGGVQVAATYAPCLAWCARELRSSNATLVPHGMGPSLPPRHVPPSPLGVGGVALVPPSAVGCRLPGRWHSGLPVSDLPRSVTGIVASWGAARAHGRPWGPATIVPSRFWRFANPVTVSLAEVQLRSQAPSMPWTPVSAQTPDEFESTVHGAAAGLRMLAAPPYQAL